MKTSDKLIIVLLAVTASGCGGPDPVLGAARWTLMPPSPPSSLFVKALSRWSESQVSVYTMIYDGQAHCSDFEGLSSGILELHFNRVAVDRPGAVPIAAALDPVLPTATLELGSRVYTSGTVMITSVDGRVKATFEATEPMSTVSGEFDATRCD